MNTPMRIVNGLALSIGLLTITQAADAADYTDWYGGGVITNTVNCPIGNFTSHVNRVLNVRFLPANIGTNGRNSSLSFLNQHWAQGYARAGAFTSTFKTVTATTIARFPGPSGYTVQVRVTRQTPATITTTTPTITLQGQVKGFSGFPTNNNCVADFIVTLFKQ